MTAILIPAYQPTNHLLLRSIAILFLFSKRVDKRKRDSTLVFQQSAMQSVYMVDGGAQEQLMEDKNETGGKVGHTKVCGPGPLWALNCTVLVTGDEIPWNVASAMAWSQVLWLPYTLVRQRALMCVHGMAWLQGCNTNLVPPIPAILVAANRLESFHQRQRLFIERDMACQARQARSCPTSANFLGACHSFSL